MEGIMVNLSLNTKYRKRAPSKKTNHGNIRINIDLQ